MDQFPEQDERNERKTALYAWILAGLTLFLLVLILLIVIRVFRIHNVTTEVPKIPGEAGQTESNGGVNDSSTLPIDEPDTGTVPVGKTYPYAIVLSRDTYLPTDGDTVTHLEPGALGSTNAVIVNLADLSVSAECGADEKIYPASMTKIMTLMVACDYISDLKEPITISEEAVKYAQENGASSAGLMTPGEVCTVEDLMYGVAVKSGAEAAYMLVRYVAGSEEAFVALMNQKCGELGLTRTHFTNSAGLYDPENYTTVREMAAIFACALDNSLCRTLLSTDTYETRLGYVKDDGTPSTYRLTMYSTLFHDRIAKYKYKTDLQNGMTVMGGKTGYIDYKDENGVKRKNFTLATYASGNGKTYLVITSGAVTVTSPLDDYQYLYRNYTD